MSRGRDRRGQHAADEFRQREAFTARGFPERGAHSGLSPDLRLLGKKERLAAMNHHDEDASACHSICDGSRQEATLLRDFWFGIHFGDYRRAGLKHRPVSLESDGSGWLSRKGLKMVKALVTVTVLVGLLSTPAKCTVQNFGQGYGIYIAPANFGYATIFIIDTTVLNNGSVGIYIGGDYRIEGTIQRVTVTQNNYGLYIVGTSNESWLRKFGQRHGWISCLTAASFLAANQESR